MSIKITRSAITLDNGSKWSDSGLNITNSTNLKSLELEQGHAKTLKVDKLNADCIYAQESHGFEAEFDSLTITAGKAKNLRVSTLIADEIKNTNTRHVSAKASGIWGEVKNVTALIKKFEDSVLITIGSIMGKADKPGKIKIELPKEVFDDKFIEPCKSPIMFPVVVCDDGGQALGVCKMDAAGVIEIDNAFEEFSGKGNSGVPSQLSIGYHLI